MSQSMGRRAAAQAKREASLGDLVGSNGAGANSATGRAPVAPVEILTAKDVAVMLKLDTKHPELGVARLRKMGQLRGKRVGRQYLYLREDVDAFLRQG